MIFYNISCCFEIKIFFKIYLILIVFWGYIYRVVKVVREKVVYMRFGIKLWIKICSLKFLFINF